MKAFEKQKEVSVYEKKTDRCCIGSAGCSTAPVRNLRRELSDPSKRSVGQKYDSDSRKQRIL